MSSRDDTPRTPHLVHDPLVGTTVAGRFQITGIIGSGGWSTVYRARDVSLNRDCALKLLRSDLVSSAEKIKRFEQEAQLASMLSHPNVCAVFDCGILDTGQPFLVLELAEGSSLSQLLKGGKAFEPGRAVHILKQVASGLAAAHQRNIIHRDLKPGNIVIATEHGAEVAKLIDFGLAKMFAEESESDQLTVTGHTIGTPAYMSPEQIRGEPLDARTDIYAYGCVAYEMASGKRAFDGRTQFDTMQMHLIQSPPKLTELNPAFPDELQQIIFKCLQKERDQRFGSMQEIESALERFERDCPQVVAQAPRATTSSRKTIVAYALGTLMAVGIVSSTQHYWRDSIPSGFSNAITGGTDDKTIAKLVREFEELRESKDASTAEFVGKRAVELLKEQHKEYSPQMVQVASGMSDLYLGQLRRKEANEYIELAFAARQKLSKPHSEELITAFKEASAAYVRSYQDAKAVPYLTGLTDLLATRRGKERKEYIEALANLARSEYKTDRTTLAEKHYTELLSLINKNLAASDPLRTACLSDLATFYLHRNDLKAAESVADQAVACLSAETPASIKLAVYQTAAHVEERSGDYKEAVALIDKGIAASTEECGGCKVDHAGDRLLSLKGSCLRKAKMFKESEAVLRESLKRLAISHEVESSYYKWALVEYVKVLRDLNRNEEASRVEKLGKLP